MYSRVYTAAALPGRCTADNFSFTRAVRVLAILLLNYRRMAADISPENQSSHG